MTEAVKRTLRINKERMWSDLMKIAEFTRPDQPYTRRSFSADFIAGRKWLQERFVEAGFEVRIDAAGNLIGTIGAAAEAGAGAGAAAKAGSGAAAKAGSGAAASRRHGELHAGETPALRAAEHAGETPALQAAHTIMLGSHSDTVLGGGRFDGVAGVICALEIGRTLIENKIDLNYNIEIVDFLAEEPSDFGLSCTGSRGMADALEDSMLAYTAPNGTETLAQAIDRIGGKTSELSTAKRNDIKAFFELHIEQGPILEREKIDIGIVTAIVGIRRVELTFIGEEDHAGTTPMNMRRDAAAAAAETMVFVRRLAEEISQSGEGHFVATTGIVEVLPGAANVVPCSARLRFDIRAENRDIMERFYKALQTFSKEMAKVLRVETDGPQILSDSRPSLCNDDLRALLRSCCDDLHFTSMDLASGAGHDAVFMSRIAPAAMVFVPCRKGKSHASEEWAEADALANGSNVLLEAIMRLNQ